MPFVIPAIIAAVSAVASSVAAVGAAVWATGAAIGAGISAATAAVTAGLTSAAGMIGSALGASSMSFGTYGVIQAAASTIVGAAVGVGAGKIGQLATGQSTRATTIPIGPFSITVGGGKPQYGVGLNIPLTKSGNVGISFGVVAGSGRKPSWNVGVNIAGKIGGKGSETKGIKFAVKPEFSWTGSDLAKGTPTLDIGLKKYKNAAAVTSDAKWIDKLFEANFGAETFKDSKWSVDTKIEPTKFSLSVDTKNGKIKLTKPKTGGITIDLDVVYVKKISDTGKELKLGAGISFGKGKPVYQLSGGIDLNKQFKIDVSDKFASQLNQLSVSLTRYKMNEKNLREKIAQKGTFKYDAATKASTVQIEGKELIPVSFNLENNKIKNVLINTQTIADYITKKLLPYPEDISWQKKIGQIMEVPILKGVKEVAGEKIPNWLMQFLAANFGGAKGVPFEQGIPQDWKNFIEQYTFPKEPEKLANWQVDFLKQYSEISGIPDKYKELEPLLEKIKKPSESGLLNSFLKGQISLPDYLNKTTYNVKDLEEQYYEVMKEENQLSTMEHVRQFLQGDPLEVGDKIKTLLDKQPEGKAKALELYNTMPEKIKYDIFSTWQRAVDGVKNIARGIPAQLDLAGRLIEGVGEYDTINLFGNEIKLPFVYWAPTPENRKLIADYAKDLIYAFTIGPFKRGMDAGAEISNVMDEHPIIGMLTGGIYPAAAGLWRTFSEDPVGSMIDLSIVSSNLKFFSNQARFASAITRTDAAGLASAGLAYEPGTFATTTLDIAKALEQASALTDPANLLFKSAQTGINTFLQTGVPDLAKSLTNRTNLSDLLAQEQHAKIMRSVLAERDATSSLISRLEGFTDAEQGIIRRAMATGDLTALPEAWSLEGFELAGKTTSKIQAAYDAISQNKYLESMRQRLAFESGIMDVEQMNARIWADAEKTYGMTQAQLKNLGFEPSYVPYLAEQSISGPLQDALNAIKPRFEKEFVGDIKSIEKLPLERAIAKHHIDFVNAASDKILTEKFISYAKEQGLATPWKLGEALEKGNVIWDPYSYIKKTDLAAEFNETFFSRLNQLGGDADAALQATFADWSTLEGSAEKLGNLLKPEEIPVFQMSKYAAYELQSNLTNSFNLPMFIERPTAWAKTAYLGGRLGWIVNDFKDNAIRVLMQSGFDATKANLLAEKWAPLIPDELAFHGIGYDLMSTPIVPAAEGSIWKKFLYANEPVNKFFGKIDAGVDKMWRQNLFASEFEREVKRGMLKDYAANFAYRWNELDKVAMSTIDDWAKNPAAYGTQIAATQEKVMKIINDTLYDGSKVLPFLTATEKNMFKSIFLFPEFMVDCFKKAATLGIRYPYQATALSNMADIYNQYLMKEGERPDWLKDAIKIGENIWLRPTAGTMFDPEWGLMNPNATMNPLIQAAIETITGRDLKTASLESPLGEPLSDPSQLYYFNPLTQKMDIISKAETIKEINATIDGYQKGITALLDEISILELSGPQVQERLKRIDQAQRMIKQVWEPQKEMYESGISTTGEAPSFIELYLRKLPQWKLLEDALQPYTKYDTSTLFSPKVIIDKKTGEPKHDINVWLQTLRLLGASVFEYDIEKWKTQQERLKKAQQTVTFGQLINRLAADDPEMLARLREDIINGAIPLEWKNLPWHEEIESKYGKAATLAPMELPTGADLETQIAAIDYARTSDKNALDDQVKIALDNLKFFQPELLSKMRNTINAVAEERKSQIDAYYDQMKQSETLFRMLDELKSASNLKDRLAAMATPVTASEIISQIVKNLKNAGATVKTKADDLTKALSEYLTTALQGNKTINFKNVVKDLAGALGQTTALTGQALLDALNKFVKIPASVTLAKQQADWATNRLNELAFIELKKSLTGSYPKTNFLAPDLQQLLAEDVFKYYLGTPPAKIFKGFDLLTDKDLIDAIAVVNADANAAIQKIQEAAIPFGDLVIKAVEKKRKETVAKVKKTYATKKRMQALFTAETIAKSKSALETAIAERKGFLESMSFAHWKDIYDPETIKTTTGKVPISAMLLALGAARLEIVNQFGKAELDSFLTSEEGQQYVNFENEVLNNYGFMAQPEAVDFYNAYKAFQQDTTKGSFNYVSGLHKKLVEDKTPMPVFYRNKVDDTLYVKNDVPTWKEESLFQVALSELNKYSRIYSTPEYKTVEKSVIKSYKTLEKDLKHGATASGWFMGVLLQK